MPYIEVNEYNPGSQARPRRLYVNVARIAYVSALNENARAVITFNDRTLSLVADESWADVVSLIDQAEEL